MFDLEIQRCTRRCAETNQVFEPGETFYSVLHVEGSDVIRRDYTTDAWKGPPENILGWWKSRMPEPHAKRQNWAPNDVMLDLFERWADDLERCDFRYVLALLLIRRRVFRQEPEAAGTGQGERLVVYCPRNETKYDVPVATPNEQRAERIQNELAELLFAEAK